MIGIVRRIWEWGKIMQKYSAWWLGLFLFLALGIILFREFYYFGTFHLYVSEPQTQVIINNKEYTCQDYFCSFAFSPGQYTVVVQKKGFQPESISLDLSLQKVSEHAVNLTQNQISLTPFVPSSPEYEGYFFPLKNSVVSSSVPFLEVEKKDESQTLVSYNDTPLARFSSSVLVSTDEVGRRAWIVSQTDVSEFLFPEKALYPVQKYDEGIQFFRPLGDDWYTFQNTESEWFSVFQKQKTPLGFSPYSEHTFCGLSAMRFVFLRYDEHGVGLFEYRTDTQKTTKLHTLEKMRLTDSVFVRCTPQTMEVYIDSNTAFRLSF